MKDETALKSILNEVEGQMLKNNQEGFKSTIKNLVKDAIKVTEDLQKEWKRKHNSQKLREKIDILRHNLDYLKRFCEGRV